MTIKEQRIKELETKIYTTDFDKSWDSINLIGKPKDIVEYVQLKLKGYTDRAIDRLDEMFFKDTDGITVLVGILKNEKGRNLILYDASMIDKIYNLQKYFNYFRKVDKLCDIDLTDVGKDRIFYENYVSNISEYLHWETKEF